MCKDYVFGDRKFGGNAQSITKNRWVHHTSFLWDYEAKNMSYLKLPAKAPQYRLVSFIFFFIYLFSALELLMSLVLRIFFWLVDMLHDMHSFFIRLKGCCRTHISE